MATGALEGRDERLRPSEGRASRVRSGKEWLPFVSEYRTLCVAPGPEVRRLLEAIGRLRPAA